MRTPLLEISGLKKSYAGRCVVDIDGIEIGKEPIEGLIGPNGAGKTTLMSLITRKVKADSGSVVYTGCDKPTDITKLSLERIARLGLVRTNQIIQDFDSLTIRDSLLLSMATSQYEGMFRLFAEKRLVHDAMAEIEEYLDYFQFEDTSGHAMSAGEKKLLDIIRCLVLKPRLLLMDEPTAGLPEYDTRKVMDLMKKKATDEGMSILIIEHDLDLIWETTEKVFFMAEGRILLEGKPEDIRSHGTVAEKYMGEGHV